MINYFLKYKFIFYLCNFIIIILYLFPGSLLGCYIYNDCKIQPQITANYIVSTNHLYAYLVLSIIGFLTYRKNNQFNILSIYLIFLSIVLEVLQYFVPNRSFEFSDLFGNLAGVVIAITIVVAMPCTVDAQPCDARDRDTAAATPRASGWRRS